MAAQAPLETLTAPSEWPVAYVDNHDGDTIRVEFTAFDVAPTELIVRTNIRLLAFGAGELDWRAASEEERAAGLAAKDFVRRWFTVDHLHGRPVADALGGRRRLFVLRAPARAPTLSRTLGTFHCPVCGGDLVADLQAAGLEWPPPDGAGGEV